MRYVHFILIPMLLLLVYPVFAQNKSDVKILVDFAPHMKINNVIELAMDFAIKQNINIAEYKIISVVYKDDTGKKEWEVEFLDPLHPEGGDFYIYVSDETGKVTNIRYGE